MIIQIVRIAIKFFFDRFTFLVCANQLKCELCEISKNCTWFQIDVFITPSDIFTTDKRVPLKIKIEKKNEL